MNNNRRQFTRINFQSPGQLILPDGSHQVEVLDLSLKGALIRPTRPMFAQVGSNAVLHVELNNNDIDLRMAVTIVHHQADCYGLACREIDLDSVTHLRRLVELNSGDEATLEREVGLLMAR